VQVDYHQFYFLFYFGSKQVIITQSSLSHRKLTLRHTTLTY